MPLFADKLAADADLNRAKHSFLERVAFYRDQITQICPPSKEFEHSYAKTIEHFNELRGQKLFFPYLGSGMGNGALVELGDGSIKYDLISGIGVHFGHLHPRLVEACLEGAAQDIVMQGNLIQNQDTVTLLELLTRSSGFDHCFLSTSGSMANENAVKILFQHKPHTTRLLAFENGFAGRTLAMAQVSDKPHYRVGLPSNLHVDYVPFFNFKEPQKSIERSVAALKNILRRYPDQHCGFCMELIQGEGGFYPGEKTFFLALIEVLKEHRIPVWADEVQSFGRTDYLFAFQHYGLENHIDIVTIGKLAHVCATLYPKSFAPKPGLLSQTFTASTSQIRSATVIVQSLIEEGYLGPNGKNMQIRERFLMHFERLAKKHPNLFEGPYGEGLMLAFTPFKGERDKVIAFLHVLFKAGIIVFITGDLPTRIRLLVPAGGITFDQIDHIATLLDKELSRFEQ